MRTLLRLRLAAAVGIAAICIAPLAAITRGPDAGGYTATDATVFSFVDISGAGGASVLSGSDDAVAALTLPFPFAFYGQSYSLVCVSSNGALYFITQASACSGVNDIGNVDLALTTPNDWPALFPFWTDLTFQAPGAGSVFYQTVGAPGNRRFVVQWHNAMPVESAKPVTFEIVLAEGTNTATFQYKTVVLGAGNPASGGGEATVGIRNAGGGSSAIEWSFNVPVLHDSSAILFSTPLTPTLTLPDSTVVYNGSPQTAPATLTGVNGEILGPLTITYNGSPTAPTNAGTYNVVASYAGNGTYTAVTGIATLTISQATPVITWANPADITQGTALGGTQLNATANVPGTFAYDPPAGTVLPTGSNQTLSTTFTPADSLNYTTATASVHINVTASGQPGRFTGDATVETSAGQTRFNFEVSTGPGNLGAISVRGRSGQSGSWTQQFDSTTVASATASGTGPAGRATTLAFSGAGRWNGEANYQFTATAVDAGEPGRGRDQFSIRITAPNGTVVLNVSGTITTGNIQSLPTK